MRFLALFLLISLVAQADPPDPPLRLGMELELSIEHLAKVTGVLDFSQIQTQYASQLERIGVKTPTIFDDYLKDNASALSHLPPEIKAKLTKGLNLQSVVQRTGNDTGLTGLGKPSLEIKKPQLILSATNPAPAPKPSGIILPGASPPTANVLPMAITQEKNGLEIPARMDWNTLYRRWAELDFNTKASLVNWDLLGPQKKAELLYYVLPGHRKGAGLPPRKDASPEVKDVLKKVQFGRDDVGVVEIRHSSAVVVNDSAEFVGDLRLMSRLAGVEQKIFDPSKSRIRGVGLHYHLSREGVDFTPIQHAYNRYLLALRINHGILNDLAAKGLYLYSDPSVKGLARWVDKSRLEQRMHLLPLKEELGFIERMLAMPPAEAKVFLDQETKKLLNPEVLDSILKINSQMAGEFKDLLPADFLSAVGKREARIQKLMAHKNDPAFWRRVPAMMTSGQVDLRDSVVAVLSRSAWPQEFWYDLPNKVLDPRYSHIDFTKLLVHNLTEPPVDLSMRFLETMKATQSSEDLKKMWRVANYLPLSRPQDQLAAVRMLSDAHISTQNRMGALGWLNYKDLDHAALAELKTFIQGPMTGLSSRPVFGALINHRDLKELIVGKLLADLRRPNSFEEKIQIMRLLEEESEVMTGSKEIAQIVLDLAPNEKNPEVLGLLRKLSLMPIYDMPDPLWEELLHRVRGPEPGSSLAVEMMAVNIRRAPEKLYLPLKDALTAITAQNPKSPARYAIDDLKRMSASEKRCAPAYAGLVGKPLGIR